MEKGLVGFIGLGIMGTPMAENLLKKGCGLLVSDVDKQRVEHLETLGASAADYSEIGRRCEIIFLSLPNGKIVGSVLFEGENCVSAQISKGALVVDLSSISPNESQQFAAKLAEKGVGFVDCPVSGGEPKAIDGTLAFMAGGAQEDFDKAYPYFMKMGTSAVLVGPSGSGDVAKLANQIIVNLNIAAVSEAFILAKKYGADLNKVYEAIKGGLAGSAVLDAKAPMMIERNFKPGGTIAINKKDIGNVMSSAHALDVPLPLTAQLLEIMGSLKSTGHLADDHSGIVQYYETISGITL